MAESVAVALRSRLLVLRTLYSVSVHVDEWREREPAVCMHALHSCWEMDPYTEFSPIAARTTP